MATESTIKTPPRLGAGRAALAGFNARFGQSYIGRSIQMGAAESFGFSYKGSMFGINATSQGFLGLRESLPEFRAARQGRPTFGKPQMGRVYSKARGMGMGKFSSTRMAVTHGARQAGMRGVGKILGKALPGGLGLAATGYFAYSGYQEGGALGAVKGVGESIAWTTAFKLAGGLANPVIGGAAIVGAVGLGIYAYGEASQAHVKKLRDIEMGGTGAIMDAIGSMPAATMRQRSVLALQNTHINGRMAMGNEALYMHTSFR